MDMFVSARSWRALPTRTSLIERRIVCPTHASVGVFMLHPISGEFFPTLHRVAVYRKRCFEECTTVRRSFFQREPVPRPRSTAGKKIRRDVKSTFFQAGEEVIQTIQHLRIQRPGVFRVFRDHEIVVMMDTHTVVAALCQLLNQFIGRLVIGERRHHAEIDTEKPQTLLRRMFKRERAIRCRNDPPVLSGWSIEHTGMGKIQRRTGENAAAIRNPSPGRIRFHRKRLIGIAGELNPAVAECNCRDHPACGRFIDAERDRGRIVPVQRKTRCVKSDRRGIVVETTGDCSIRQGIADPPVAAIEMGTYRDRLLRAVRIFDIEESKCFPGYGRPRTGMKQINRLITPPGSGAAVRVEPSSVRRGRQRSPYGQRRCRREHGHIQAIRS